MDNIQRLFRYKILPIYWAFLTYILLKPVNIKPEDLWVSFGGMDKCVHVSVFGILAFCYLLAFPKQRFSFFMLIMLGYAAVTEILQEIMGWGRSMEMLDFVADSVGVLFSYWFWRKFFKK